MIILYFYLLIALFISIQLPTYFASVIMRAYKKNDIELVKAYERDWQRPYYIIKYLIFILILGIIWPVTTILIYLYEMKYEKRN